MGLLAGCQRNAAPVHSHEAGPGHAPAAILETVLEPRAAEDLEHNVDLILDDLRDPRKRSTLTFRREAERLHLRLIPETATLARRRYLLAALEGCGVSDLSHCLHLEFAAQTGLWTDLVLAEARELQTPLSREQLLRVVFQSRPASGRPEAVVLWAEHVAQKLSVSSRGDPTSATRSPHPAEEWLRTLRFQIATLTPLERRQFAPRLAAVASQLRALPAGTPGLSATFLQSLATSGELEERARQEFRRIQMADAHSPGGFFAALTRVRQQVRSPDVLKRWGVQRSSHQQSPEIDESSPTPELLAFIVVHQLYSGTPAPQLSEWTEALDPGSWLNMALWYLRVRFWHEVIVTAETMGGVFQDFFREGRERSELLAFTRNRGEARARSGWSTLGQGLFRLEAYFRQRVEMQTQAPSVRDFREFLGNFHRNASIFAGTSSTLALAAFAIRADYKETLRGPFGAVDLDARILARIIMDGTLNTMFTFTSIEMDNLPRGEPTLLAAMAAILDGRLDSLFGFSPGEFAENLSRALLAAPIAQLAQHLGQMQRMQGPTGELTQLFNVCESLRSRTSVVIPTQLSQLLQTQLWGGYGGTGHLTPLRETLQLWTTHDSGSITEVLEVIRTDVRRRSQRLRTWISLAGVATPAQVTAANELARDAVEALESLTPRVTECHIELTRAEHALRRHTWQRERQFLELIAAKAQELESVRSQLTATSLQERLRAVNEELAQAGGLDVLRDNGEFWNDYLENGGLRWLGGQWQFRYRQVELSLRVLKFIRESEFGRFVRWEVPLAQSWRELHRPFVMAPTDPIAGSSLRVTDIRDGALTLFNLWTYRGLRNRQLLSPSWQTVNLIMAQHVRDRFERSVIEGSRGNTHLSQAREFMRKALDLNRAVLDLLALSPEDEQFLNEDLRNVALPESRFLQFPFVAMPIPFEWGGLGDDLLAGLASDVLGHKPVTPVLRGADEGSINRVNRSDADNPLSDPNPRLGLRTQAEAAARSLQDFRLGRWPLRLSDEQKQALCHQSVDLMRSQLESVDQLLAELAERHRTMTDMPIIRLFLDEPAMPRMWHAAQEPQYRGFITRFHETTLGLYREPWCNTP